MRDGWLQPGLAPARLARGRPRGLRYRLHRRLLAPPSLQLGPHGNEESVAPFWDALYDADADLVLVGHDHLYERFAPQAPDGSADQERGIRQFTVGNGGRSLYADERDPPNSELVIDDAFGVLELTLHADSYEWRFITVDGIEADAGTGECH